MEAILPYNTTERDVFVECAAQIGFDEFMAKKFLYMMHESDIDTYQIMVEDRLSLLIYGWHAVQSYAQNPNNDTGAVPDSLIVVLKRLTYCTLDVWFSKEWEFCRPARKLGVLFAMRSVKTALYCVDNFSMIDWEYLFQFDMKPWLLQYLNTLFGITMNEQKHDEYNRASIESVEQMVINEDDISFTEREGLLLVLLRCIKLLDSGSIEAAKYMSIRMVATYNVIYAANGKPFNEVEKHCLILICHIYLMTLYELDDVRGFYIDNMVNNIRFYCANMQNKEPLNGYTGADIKLTAAQQIATACTNLNVSGKEFFEAFVYDKFDKCVPSVFGVLSQSYLSYVLGNMLNEMNNMNEEDFSKNLEQFKQILNYYILEREHSEKLMLCELQKVNRKRRNQTLSLSMTNMQEFKNKFCKGNRMSNIGNYVNADEAEQDTNEANDLNNLERGRQIDPIFQNIPRNANILNYVYDTLAIRTYKGWHFAKLVLLLKIIGNELNEIETWRYHPGLSTEFMLNLEKKLSKHYEDLAKIFEEHQFLEQEFWLTAFYLNPNSKYYGNINRCAQRWNRRRNIGADATEDSVKMDKLEKLAATSKFGLLSSTFDVHEIIKQTNLEAPDGDYNALQEMLRSLYLPQNVVKDLLTVCFQRNKAFAWAVNWGELRKRCKTLYKIEAKKRRLVELNMADAIDRLKFLKIDYEKYKNRPQLDYGAIEEGYEGTKYAEVEVDSSVEDFEDDEDDYEYLKEINRKAKEEKIDEELLDECFIGTRRTRARTAAVIASVQKEKRLNESKKADVHIKLEIQDSEIKEEVMSDEENHDEIKQDEQFLNEIKHDFTMDINIEPDQNNQVESKCNSNSEVTKTNLNTWLKEHTPYNNSTEGFKVFPNIWDFDAKTAESIADSSTYFENKTKHICDLIMNLKNTEETLVTTQPLINHIVTDVNEMSFADDGDSSTVSLDSSLHIPFTQLIETIQNNVESLTAKISECPTISATQESHPTEPTNDVVCTEENDMQSTNQDSDTERLIRECIENDVRVLIPRLTVADIGQLRQPKVFIERINWMNLTLEGLSILRKVTDYESSSKSSGDTLLSELSQDRQIPRKMAPKSKRRPYMARKRYCSDSSSSASDEDKVNYRIQKMPRRTTSHTASHSKKILPHKSSITAAAILRMPSSLSDNSVDATHTTKFAARHMEFFDFIQISSSSSQDVTSPVCIDTTTTTDHSNREDPLFEEEIII